MSSIMLRTREIALIGMLFFGIIPTSHATFVTGLSDIQIQNVLENYFPMSEYAAFARVSLHKPKVRLQKENKNIVLIIPVVANVSGGVVHRGHVTVEVQLAYKSPTGGLYFSHPTIQQFDVPAANKETLTKLREIVKSMGENSLPVVRIYTVNERELNHSLAKSALKTSTVEDGRLHLEFGFK